MLTMVGKYSLVFYLSCSVPFDDNYFSLKSELFAPPATSYVNASKISFPDLEQTFIACQAPKPLSFKHFWHMVIQEQVGIEISVAFRYRLG